MAYLGQPTSITSFHSPLPSSSTTTKANVGPQLRIAPVHGSEEPQVVAAVQGAALWFYDVGDTSRICFSSALLLTLASPAFDK